MKRLLLVAAIAVVASGHVGSPDVFFSGKAGPYDVRVVIRPPQVVPGIATVIVRTTEDMSRVSVRPVHWRAGSRGAPAADATRRLAGSARTFEGSLWLMERGAYSVDVIVEGSRGAANVLVPVASVATGRLDMSGGLAALLVVLAVVLCAGLATIVYKSAGEALVPVGEDVDVARLRRARRVALASLPVVALALLGGARWWSAVDREYARTLYRPSPVALSVTDGVLQVALTDTLWQPPRRPSALIADHGKLMHLFLVRDDARAFAHLHPRALDTTAIPRFASTMPALPPGDYRAYADVVHETGFERTLVGNLALDSATRVSGAERVPSDPDDATWVGEASRESRAGLQDGTRMLLDVEPAGPVYAGVERTLRIMVIGDEGPARLEPYLGMNAHAVVMREDGSVYVHLHPMGTVSTAAQEAFLARDRGDTTDTGRLRRHDAHVSVGTPPIPSALVEFPYAFPKAGRYRLFVQVKRNGRILTGAYAITVDDPPAR